MKRRSLLLLILLAPLRRLQAASRMPLAAGLTLRAGWILKRDDK
jgi:hypothetical protein